MTGHPRLRRTLRDAGVVLTAAVGGLGGMWLVPDTNTDVGPLTVAVSLTPSLESETVVDLPPVGAISFDTHDLPVKISASLVNVDLEEAEALLNSPDAFAGLEQDAVGQIVRGAVLAAVARALGAAAGAGIAVALVYRRPRRAAIAAVSAGALFLAVTGLTGATFDARALSNPKFDGLLTQAPYIAEFTKSTATSLESYRTTLVDFIGHVSNLYVAAESLPDSLGSEADVITVLHVSDIHLNPLAFSVIDQLVDQFDVDLVIDTGDIVSWGTPIESQLLTGIASVDAPYVFIKGNHDSAGTAAAVAAQPNATVLDGDVTTIDGLTIAGIGDPRSIATDDSGGSGDGFERGKDRVQESGDELGSVITTWNEENPDQEVEVALIHDPSRPEGLLGTTPLVLSGHMHSRAVDWNVADSGTSILTEGSTGGALAAGGLAGIASGEGPEDLDASLLYFSRSGDDEGKLLAYDDVTMGGLGLMSVSMQRNIVPDSTWTPLSIPTVMPADVDDDSTDPPVDDPRTASDDSSSDSSG